MIGDWVKVVLTTNHPSETSKNVIEKYTSEKEQIIRCGHVMSKSIAYNKYSEEFKVIMCIPVVEEDVYPIPITQEMLEYNFVDLGHYQYGNLNEFQELRISVYSDGIYEVKVEEIEFSSLPTWKMYVSHVHELQHALRLCGLNEIADNFKLK